MKFLKILAVVMAVCLLGTAFIACDKKDGEDVETKDPTVTDVEIKLVIKNGTKVEYEGSVKCNGKLGNALEMFCIGEFDQEENIFDHNNQLLTVGELTAGDGKHWKAYYEDEGQSKAFESIKDQALANGKTIVIVLG